MALNRRNRSSTNIWPGFVDALATLLMVIIFVLMIFVVSQFYLSDALEGRDEALERLNHQISELADLLSLERQVSDDLRTSVAQISGELQSSLSVREDLAAQLDALSGVRDSLSETQAALDKIKKKSEQAAKSGAQMSAELEQTYVALEEVNKSIAVDKETIQVQLRQLATLKQDIAALAALREALHKQIAEIEQRAEKAETAAKAQTQRATDQAKVSRAARAQAALLNRQMTAMRQQIAKLNAALEASELKDKTQQVRIANLGQRLNAALARKVQELTRYRSEFFGRLRKVLGNRRDVQIVGDRFIFQSEVLFKSGSDELGAQGKTQLAKLAKTLLEISRKIPPKINWILRVDGHTDRIPINNLRFASNWELSTARAISVVKFLHEQAIPEKRLAATGFGEHQPLDSRDDEIAFRRNRRIELKLDQR
ncbi:MAG: peptidoglycan -binding protein [Alphaproteobacteria bacterium]|nr:peptidoglycan -binding protein [Alphaproteobacteria bacterium]